MDHNSNVRTRFAPSPTGSPHIGNMRTALYDWLLAHKHGGQFVLRIEDTDQSRYNPAAVSEIMDGLRWLGLEWDEGPDVGGPCAPYIQSQRRGFYTEAAEKLIDNGNAYMCDCTPEQLEAMRERQRTFKRPPGYDGRCRTRDPEEVVQAKKNGQAVVVRFKTPFTGSLSFTDTVYGHISFDVSTLDDFVILKSDGMPTYHLAHVLDDSAMKISHVIRGEEWISSVPKHLLIQKGLQISPPIYAHVPLLLGKDKAKLSKRQGAVSVLEYRDIGCLPEAVINYLALLGWSPEGDREIFGISELMKRFNLNKIQSSPAVFDSEKLEWMNGVYIRSINAETLAKMMKPFLERPAPEGGLPEEAARPLSMERLRELVPLIQERIRRLDDAPSLLSFFFVEKLEYTPAMLLARSSDGAITAGLLEEAARLCETAEPYDAKTLEELFRGKAAELSIGAGKFFYPVRIAVTGQKAAPPLFDTLAALGRELCTVRIRRASSLALEAKI